ncbi:MAG: alkyl hydroperoxide reductase subunit F [Bacteroidales bacterium]|jgi:alkyl hydroperoxide reductase subunit F|nr:alkyl hydroperoxide reductase subunit F [Bacteroidales bacterium]
MLEFELKNQLKSVFSGLNNNFVLDIYVAENHPAKNELLELVSDLADCSEKITYSVHNGNSLEMNILRNQKPTNIYFRGVPNGHEFTSLLMAILNADGKGKNLPDEFITQRIKNLNGKINLTTYVSLTCTNCPDVVQSLNIMALLNENIRHEMVEGSVNEEEVESLHIQGVPTVYADGQLLHVGKSELGELLAKLEKKYGSKANITTEIPIKSYDVVVAGGGPAGVAAAIYSARKGLKVCVLADRIGGQVKETVAIENLISVPQTTGEQLANNLKKHLQNYPIDIAENRQIEKFEIIDNQKVITVVGGEKYTSDALIIATGASWKKLNVTGENQYIGKGVAFCPHCDGPFYKGKHVAVIGGGNSGIEAAIDLAGICAKVTVIEFLETLKADLVLQKKVNSLPNVEIILNTQTTEIVGDSNKVTAIRIKNRNTAQEHLMSVDGIFVQIGLSANSQIFSQLVETNKFGEIVIDTHCRTSLKGVYAAGDVSEVPYKQIIIAMGEGAKAALAAFEDKMRNLI